jgi:hypothetical protein
MPPEYLSIFLKGLPEPDAYLGEYEDGEGEDAGTSPSFEELREDPDVQAVLEAAALAA